MNRKESECCTSHLICHRTEYHGSSCIWPAGSRCQETFMPQWLHWWLSSLYFVVSHKGTARARAFLSPVLCIEVKIPPTIVTSKTLSKRKINQFGIQEHTCISIINTCIIFRCLHILQMFLYISPTSQVTPQVSHPKTESQRRHAGRSPS